MKIITAFDSFKGCLSAKEACSAAKQSLQNILPDANIISIPMSDGGEGMVDCIFDSIDATRVETNAHDAIMRPLKACYAISSDGQTAFMEMATACGLSLIEEDLRNPLTATTYGVGEMVLDAVRRGCKNIMMGIGGSATCDGGKGMIDVLTPHLPLDVNITVACDVTNPLYGENGAAYVFAPQKGATPNQVKILDQRLRDFAQHTESIGIASHDVCFAKGAGAAGGLGYGLMAYLHARLVSGIDLILDTIDFNGKIKDANLIITGEGKSDSQTLMGKVPMGILERAKKQGIPVVILSGCIEDKESLIEAGFADAISINEDDSRPLAELLQKETATKNIVHTIHKMYDNYICRL